MEDNQLQPQLLDQNYAFFSVHVLVQNAVITEEATIGPTSGQHEVEYLCRIPYLFMAHPKF